MEIVSIDGSGTFRTTYIANLSEALYVLHSFQKKSKSGVYTPKRDLKTIEKRLALARAQHEECKSKGVKKC